MDALQNLFNRRSVRDFTAQPIEEEKLHRILEAGMSGPCCVNARDWSFIVVTDREKLLEMAEANGRPAQPLKKAAAAHSDLRRSRACIPTREGLLDHRRRHCVQNMTLCADALGLGSVWLGTWPQMDRVEKQAALFNLPETIVPHSILALGYPAEENKEPRESRYEENRVHFEKW